MSGEKIHKKNGDSVPDNFHFPQETVLFHPELQISLLLQIHSQPYKRAWLPKRKHKSQKNETDIALKIAPFWKIHSFFKLYGRLIIALTS